MKKLLSCVFTSILLSGTAHAFSLTPMSTSLEPSGPRASTSFQVDNPSDQTIAVDIALARREMDLDGKETLVKLMEQDKHFLIFPPQMVIKPKEKRTIRVSYVGDANLQDEQAFRLTAEQLPVQTDKAEKTKGAVIKVLLKYVAALYVTPKTVQSKVVIKEAMPYPGRKMNLVFENQGKAHQLLSNIQLKIKAESPDAKPSSVTLNAEDLPSISGQNILAGKTRRFQIPWLDSWPQSPVKVEFELKD